MKVLFNKKVAKREPIINFSKIPSTRGQDKSYYFTATLFPSKNLKNKKKPKSICIYWDSSLSMKTRNIQKELDFITEYVKTLGNSSLSLITQKVLGKFVIKNEILLKIHT